MDAGSDQDDSFTEYSRSIRDRASDSIHDLRRQMNTPPASSPAHRRSRSPARHHSPGSTWTGSPGGTWAGRGAPEHSDYTYGAAVDKLRDLLDKHRPQSHAPTPKTVQFSPHTQRSPAYVPSYGYQTANPMFNTPPAPAYPAVPPGMPRGQLPTPEEVVPLLQNQSGVVQQLTAESNYCKEELRQLKSRVREVVEENRLLHEELKRTTVHDLLQADLQVPGIPTELEDVGSRPVAMDADRPLTRQDYCKWQKELDRIKALHTAKATRLEAQLAHSRDELEQAEKEVVELKSRFRMQESLYAVDADSSALMSGLCVRCAQNEAVLPSTFQNQKETIDRVTKERDELVTQVTRMRGRVEELQSREEEAYQQVKRSVDMVEQAQLEQTQALVQREQVKEELISMRARLEEHTIKMAEKMNQERELVRKENKAERDELNERLKEMTEQLVTTQTELERTMRDKMAVTVELETARSQVSFADLDYGKATDSMKMTMTTATLERNAAMQEMKRLKMELEQADRDRDQERHCLKTELNDIRRRLHVAERDLVESKEECIRLTTHSQALEREAHMAKIARENIERTRKDDLRGVQRRAEQREQELNVLIDGLQTRQGQTVSELEDLLDSERNLVGKLREECYILTNRLEQVTTKYKHDNKKLKAQVEELRIRLDKATPRLRELEDQNAQHGVLQEKMRARLRQMDDHAQHSSQQILDLLAKESSLMRDRQLLAREVEFQRRQAKSGNESDLDKLYPSRMDAVDEILYSVRNADPYGFSSSKRDVRLDSNKLPSSQDIVPE